MPYRKTDSILAAIEARKAKVLAAAIAVIAKSGIDGLTTGAVAARAKMSPAVIYKYYPDMAELRAATVAAVLARDRETMRQGAAEHDMPMGALAAALQAYFSGLGAPCLVRTMMAEPIYRIGITTEIDRLIRVTSIDLTPKAREMAAAGALGAMLALYETEGGFVNRTAYALQFVLRGIGVSDALARKLISA